MHNHLGVFEVLKKTSSQNLNVELKLYQRYQQDSKTDLCVKQSSIVVTWHKDIRNEGRINKYHLLKAKDFTSHKHYTTKHFTDNIILTLF